MLKVYIHHYYHGVIVIKKDSKIIAKMLKIEGLWGKSNRIDKTHKNTVMPHGRRIYAKHLTRKRKQCVHIQSQIMHYHTENVSCDVVPDVQA